VELVNPESGEIRAAFGTDDFLGAPLGEGSKAPVVHAFRPLPDGKFVYVGPFQVIDYRDKTSILQAAWRLRAGDVQQHFQNRNGQWRFRALVPPAREERFRKLQSALTLGDEALFSRINYVKDQLELIQLAQDHFDLRVGELLGAGQPADAAQLDEYALGLQEAIGREEEARNAELHEIDRLRNALRDQYAQTLQFTEQNGELIKRLPQPAGSTAGSQVTSR
jgi:hypothetical protein